MQGAVGPMGARVPWKRRDVCVTRGFGTAVGRGRAGGIPACVAVGKGLGPWVSLGAVVPCFLPRPLPVGCCMVFQPCWGAGFLAFPCEVPCLRFTQGHLVRTQLPRCWGPVPLPVVPAQLRGKLLLVSFQAGATDVLFLCRSDASLYCDDVDIRFSKTMNSCKVLQIRYASVERLLERLTDLRFLSIDFLNTFLHSYRVFTTALVVLDKLITIYKKPISAIPAR